jgi:DMSO/TMAO reductase YedYZ molybdopterin-dependent catalytic subunit
VPVSYLLDRAAVPADASEVTFIALDRYSRTLPIDVARRDGTFIAYEVNGVPIPLKHGYPLRLVVKGLYGENWVKWLRQIDVK